MIARGFETLAAFGECGVKFIGTLDRGAEDGRAKAMEFAAGGVDDEKALRGKDRSVKIAEGLREVAAGFVSSHESVGRFGRAKKFGGAFDKGRDGFVKNDTTGGDCGIGSLAVGERGQLATGRKGDVIDLGEIVIFTGEPEDGGVGMACGSRLACARNGGGSFERGIQRPAEQANLLASENSACALFECGERIFSSGGWVLFGQEMDKLGPVRGARRLRSTNLVQR